MEEKGTELVESLTVEVEQLLHFFFWMAVSLHF